MRQIKYPQDANNKYLLKLGFTKTTLPTFQHSWVLLRNQLIKYNKDSQRAQVIYKQDFKEILTSKYEDLLEMYLDWIDNDFGNTHPLIKTDAEKLFNYSERKNYIADFFIENADKMDITTCFYCETSYINIFKDKNKKRRTFDVDHFLPNKQSPITAISLYNFVPSCIVCNRMIKGRSLFDNLYKLKKITNINDKRVILSNLSPTSTNYEYDKNVTISINPTANFNGPIGFTDVDNQYYIKFDVQPNTYYQKANDAFKIEQRYNYVNNKAYALMCLDLKQRYPDSKINDIAKLLKVSPDEVREDIFHEEKANEFYFLFGKMRKDILGW